MTDKTDEPAKFNILIKEAIKTFERGKIVANFEDVDTDLSDEKDSFFNSENINDMKLFLRAPKPGQTCSPEYKQYATELLGTSLKTFIDEFRDLADETHDSFVSQTDIHSLFTGLELIQYNYWELEL